MLGKDLIIYILQNGLENEPVYEDGRLLGFMNVMEAAIKFDVGAATIETWIKMEQLDSVRIGNVIFIPADAKDPRERNNDEKNCNLCLDTKRIINKCGVSRHNVNLSVNRAFTN